MNTETDLQPEPDEKSTGFAGKIWQRRWLRVVTFVLLATLAILIALPIVAKQQLQKWLLENGADHAVIENIDFNPFYGTFSIHGMDVRVADKTVLSDATIFANLAWLELLRKGIVLQQVTLQSVSVDIEQRPDGSWLIGSLVIPAAERDEKNVKQEVKQEVRWWLALDRVELRNSRVTISIPKLKADLRLADMVLENFDTRSGSIDARLALDMTFNGAPVKGQIDLKQHTPAIDASAKINFSQLKLADFAALAGDALSTLEGMARADGKIVFKSAAKDGTTINYAGTLQLDKTTVGAAAISSRGETLSWDGDISVQLAATGDNHDIKANGGLTAAEISAELPDIALSTTNGKVAWHGQLDYSGNETGRDIKVKGQLDGEQLGLTLAKQELSITQQQLSATPELQLKLGNETGLAGTAQLKLDGLSVTDTTKQLVLLAIDSLGLNDIKAESLQQASVAGMAIKGTSLIQGQGSETPSIAVGDTVVTNLQWIGDSLAIDKIAINTLTGSLTRHQDGSMDLLKALQRDPVANTSPPDEKTTTTDTTSASPEAGTSAQAPVAGSPATQPANEQASPAEATQPASVKSSPATAMTFRIGELSISQDSLFKFTDQTVEPTFNTVLDVASLNVKDIDSARPDQPIALSLQGKLNNYGKLDVNGTVKPFTEQPAVNLTASLHGQNMVNMSPYLIASTGYLVKAGLLDLDSKIVISDGAIDAHTKLFMKKLHLQQVNSQIAKESAGSIGMPLDKALGMLRDSNDNIKLDIPIKGKLDEVDIGIGSVINTALKKATTVGMKTYLLYAFQPYGAAILLAEQVGKQAGKIRLDPLIFEPGKAELTAQHVDYLSKLGKVMQDRPQVIVQICGYVTAADHAGGSGGKDQSASGELVGEMLRLGQERQKLIKDHMISKYQIDEGRLVLCAPEYDQSQDAKPRVELII